MRILHIWNTAGVGSIIAKYMDKLLGTESLVIHRLAFDPYGVTTYGELWNCGPKTFVLKALLKARKFDITHIHYFDKIVPYLKSLYSKKPIVLHYHGDDIRRKWSLRYKYWRNADAVLYSTPDLLDDETPTYAIYLPNPVDMELFRPMLNLRSTGSGLYLIKHQEGEDVNWPQRVAERYCLKLHVHDLKTSPIAHSRMPYFLNRFEFYIDQNYIPSLSKTALEALACGLKVIRWDEEIVEKLPEEHDPAKVVTKLWNIYQKLAIQ